MLKLLTDEHIDPDLVRGLLARQPQAGGQGGAMIQIPLSAQDGRLYVAGLPLTRLSPIPLD